MHRVLVAVLVLWLVGSTGAAAADAPVATATPTITPDPDPEPDPEPPPKPPDPPVVEATVSEDTVTAFGGGPAHANAVTGTIHTPLGLAWTAEVTAQQLLAVPGTLIAVGNPGLTAMDPATGLKRWAISETVQSAAIVGDAVIAAVGDSISAYALADGVRRWTAPKSTAGYGTSPVPAGDLVLVQGYVESSGSALRALEAATGAVRWSHDMPNTALPSVVGDRVYLGSCGGGHLVLDRRDGHVIAQREGTCSGGSVYGTAAVGRTVRVGMEGAFDMHSFGMQPVVRWEAARPGLGLLNTGEATIDGVDPVEARQHWRAKLPFITGTALLAGDTAVVVSREGVAVLDAATGAQRWAGRFTSSHHTGSSDGHMTGIAALGSVFVAKGETLMALRPGAGLPPAKLSVGYLNRVQVLQYGAGFTVEASVAQAPLIVPREVVLASKRSTSRRVRERVAARTTLADSAVMVKLKPSITTDYELLIAGNGRGKRFSAIVLPRERTSVRRSGADNNTITWSARLRVPPWIGLGGRTYALYVARRGSKRYHRLDAATLRRTGRGRGKTVLRFRAPRMGANDFFRSCVTGVSRRGMSWHDRLDRRCGRASVRF